jgi:hypothetical protein
MVKGSKINGKRWFAELSTIASVQVEREDHLVNLRYVRSKDSQDDT